MENKKYLLGILLSCMVISCSQHELSNDSQPVDGRFSRATLEKVELTNAEAASIAFDNPTEISENEVLDILNEFCQSSENGLKSAPNASIVSKYFISNENDAKQLTKSAYSSNSAGISIPIYEIQVVEGSDEGVAYVSADSRIPKVLAYVPKKAKEGTETAKDIMLDLSQKAALDYVNRIKNLKDSLREQTLEKVGQELGLKSVIEFDGVKDYLLVADDLRMKSLPVENPSGVMVQVGPFASVQWGQSEPYNIKLPKLPMFNDMHFPAGCGVVAMATCLSIVTPDMKVNSINVNWAYLKQRPYIVGLPLYGNPTETVDPQDKLDMMGYLIHDIYYGSSTTTAFDKDPYFGSSGTTSANMESYLKKHINIDTWRSMNLDDQLVSMNARNPIVMSGTTVDKSGSHAWVIDGYRLCKKRTRELIKIYDIYFHANMGWDGTDDGYYMIASDLSLDFETGANHYNSNLHQMCNARKK